MTPFDFVFFLYAIMLSLGLTHLLGGWATALRNASSVRWSAPNAMWTLTALFYTTGNLTSFWMMRDAPRWSAGLVLGNFGFAITNYVLCVFITPESKAGTTLDLVEFHEKQRKRYLAATVALLVIAVLNNIAIGIFADYEHWWSDSVSSVAAIIPALAARRWTQRWVQLIAGATVMAISAYFLVDSSNIVVS